MDPILQAARAGDAAAIEDLADRFRPLVSTYLERRVGAHLTKRGALEDLEKEVFAKTLPTLGSLPDDANFDAFASRLLKNAQWVVARASTRAAGFAGADAAAPTARLQAMSSEWSTGAVSLEDELGRVRALTQTLSEPAQHALLRRIAGRTHDEIAVESGEPVEAIRERYESALLELRAYRDARDARRRE